MAMSCRSSSLSLYSPLNPAEQQIRILKVDTSSLGPNGYVKCRLEIVSLRASQITFYQAISWCWGDRTQKVKILLNDVEFEVPRNAEEVLRRLCFEQGHACVWLDAVCINQDDLAERGHQVAMMNDVYSKAARCLVWLGEDDVTTPVALLSIDALLHQCRESTNDLADIESHFWTCEKYYNFSYEPLPDINFDALNSYYSASWFSRLWIVQEVILGKDAVCYRGNFSKPWSEVSLAAQWMRHRQYSLYYRRKIPGVEVVSNIWCCVYTKFSFTNLLLISMSLQASEPLDKIYAHLGLARSERSMRTDLSSLSPDYTRTLSDVYTAATRVAIDSHSNRSFALRILSAAQVLLPPVGKEESSRDTPSWVPRYDWGIDFVRGSSQRGFTKSLRVGASAGIAVSSKPEGLLPAVLSLEGLVFSQITWSSKPLDHSTLTNSSALAATLLEILAQARPQGYREDEIALTLTQGSTTACRQAADFSQRFSKLITECLHRANNIVQDRISWDLEQASSNLFSPSARPLSADLTTFGINNRFFLTASGHMGMGNANLQNGHVAVILFGGRMPFVLRKLDMHWSLVGDAYIHGVMEGEYVKQLVAENRLETEKQWFDIH